VQKLPGEAPGGVAGVIYALLNEYRWDLPPPKKMRRKQ